MIRRVAVGVGVNVFDKLVVAGSQLVLIPVLVTAWGLHLYGLWVMLATVPSFLAMGDFGFATAAGTKMTMAHARGDRAYLVSIFQSAWVVVLGSSAVMIVMAAALVWFAPAGLFGADPGLPVGEVRATLFLLMLYGIAAVQGTIFFAGFRAVGQFAIGAFWNAIILLIENGALIAAVMLGAHPVAASATLLVGRLVGLAGQNLLLRRQVPWLAIGLSQGSRTEMRSLLAPAGAVMLLPIAQACALQGSVLALGAAAGQAAIPAFTAARTLSRVGLQLCWLLNAALMPEFSAAAARVDRRAMAGMVLATLVCSTALVVPFALGFALFGQSAILLWTKQMVHIPQPLAVIMALSILFGGFWYPIANLILALNRHASYTMWYMLFAASTIPATYFLSARYGTSGAGFGLMLLDLAMLLVVSVLARRLLVSGSEVRAAIPVAFAFAARLGARRPVRPSLDDAGLPRP